MPSLLNIIPNAVGQGQAQLVYAQVTTPQPNSFGDPLYVVMPDWSVDFPIAFTDWPAVHGLTLPIPGDDVLLVTDSRGIKRVVYWDGEMTFADQTTGYYYLTPTASDDPDATQATGVPYQPMSAPTSTTTTDVATGQQLHEWVTNPGLPNLTFLPAGQFELHIHALQSGGNEVVQLYGEIWEEDYLGNQIARIGTTQLSLPLTSVETEYRLFFTTENVYEFSSFTSRVAAFLFPVVGGTGGASITFLVGGQADTHFAFPTSITNLPPNWNTAGLGSGWSAGSNAPQYARDQGSIVRLRGSASGVAGTTALTLPAGYRPGVTDYYPGLLYGGGSAWALIATNGVVTPETASIYLNGITFPAEN